MSHGRLPAAHGATGPLRHVVLLRWRTDADPTKVADTLQMICELARTFSGVRANLAEPDLGIVDGNWDACLVVDFQNRASWRRYLDDPSHMQLVTERLHPLVEERAAAQVSLSPAYTTEGDGCR